MERKRSRVLWREAELETGQHWKWPTLTSEPMAISGSMLLLRVMSGAKILLQPRSV